MARPRQAVDESLERLEELETLHQGTPREIQLRALRLLRESPTRTFAEVGEAIGRSERSVQRWWTTYKRGGLEAVLKQSTARRGRPRKFGDQERERLREHLSTHGFGRLKDAQEWVRGELGLHYSKSSLWAIMRQEQAMANRWTLGSGNSGKFGGMPGGNGSGGVLSAAAIAFLNSLPTVGTSLDWINSLRESLRLILGDVDRISISLNTECDLVEPENYEPDLVISYTATESTAGALRLSSQHSESGHYERILDGFRRQGVPLEQFHPPTSFDYYYGGYAYLGTIFLWKDLQNPPISETSIALVEALEPFLVFVLSDFVVRHQRMRPIDSVFHDALEHMTLDAGLSSQERRIVILQLLGHSYKEMAEVMNIAVDTVKKHFKKIHQKTGTRGQAELFAKYFTSRISTEENPDQNSDQ